MSLKNIFKWRHFEKNIIILNVRWYLRYSVSYRDLEKMMLDRGLKVDHTTLNRWVLSYAPEFEKRCRPYLRRANDSYRVDETYIKVKGKWKYLYRSVDSQGNTIDFLLRDRRDKVAAKRFFRKALKSFHAQVPRVITVDKMPLILQRLMILKKKVFCRKPVKSGRSTI